jgi:hypothetical protein
MEKIKGKGCNGAIVLLPLYQRLAAIAALHMVYEQHCVHKTEKVEML